MSIGWKAATGNVRASQVVWIGWMVFPAGFPCTTGKAHPYTALQRLAVLLPCALCPLLSIHFSSHGPSWPLSAPSACTLPELSCCAYEASYVSASQEHWAVGRKGRVRVPTLVPFHAEEGDPQEGLSEARLTEEWGAGSKDRDPACCWSSQSFLSLPVRVVIL